MTACVVTRVAIVSREPKSSPCSGRDPRLRNQLSTYFALVNGCRECADRTGRRELASAERVAKGRVRHWRDALAWMDYRTNPKRFGQLLPVSQLIGRDG